jgi:hypothetical protein
LREKAGGEDGQKEEKAEENRCRRMSRSRKEGRRVEEEEHKNDTEEKGMETVRTK